MRLLYLTSSINIHQAYWGNKKSFNQWEVESWVRKPQSNFDQKVAWSNRGVSQVLDFFLSLVSWDKFSLILMQGFIPTRSAMIQAGLLLLIISPITLTQKNESTIDSHSLFLNAMCSIQLSNHSNMIRDADLRCKNLTYVSFSWFYSTNIN